MIIYHVPEADAGERWLPTQDQAVKCAKAYSGRVETVKAGEDGRQGMCEMLNTAEQQMAERLTGDEAAPAKPFMLAKKSDLHPPYESPWGARGVLADMDVNATKRLIAQLDGKRLGIITAACIERMEALRQELVS